MEKKTDTNKKAFKNLVQFSAMYQSFCCHVSKLWNMAGISICFISRMPREKKIRIGQPTRQKWKYHGQPGKWCLICLVHLFHFPVINQICYKLINQSKVIIPSTHLIFRCYKTWCTVLICQDQRNLYLFIDDGVIELWKSSSSKVIKRRKWDLI